MPAPQQIHGERRLDERLVEVLSSSGLADQLKQKTTSASQRLSGHSPASNIRPNDDLDAAMAGPVASLPKPSSTLRQNDLLDMVMGAGSGSPSPQSTAMVPAGRGEQGLVLANVFRELVKSIDGKMQRGGGSGGALQAGPQAQQDCDYCGLMTELVAAAKSIDHKMDKIGGGSPMRALTYDDGKQASLPDSSSWVQNILNQLQVGFQIIINTIISGIQAPAPPETKEEKKEESWWSKTKKRGKEAFGHFSQGFANTAPVGTHGMGGGIGAAGDMMKGAGTLAGMIPVIGGPIEALGKFGDVAFKAVDRLQKWSEQLHQSNMQFAEFSAGMAQVEAEQRSRDIDLSRRRGDRRAGTAGELAEAKSGLAESTSKWGDAVGNIGNKIGAFVLDKAVNPLLKKLDFIADSINEAFGGEEKVTPPALGEWERGIDQWQKELQDQGRPARFR